MSHRSCASGVGFPREFQAFGYSRLAAALLLFVLFVVALVEGVLLHAIGWKGGVF